MVGPQTLDLRIMVRIHAWQLFKFFRIQLHREKGVEMGNQRSS